jgi:GDP-D-mannose 3', 5'-epimerase
VWDDLEQTRSFLHRQVRRGTVRLLRSNLAGPVKIGSEELVTINQLVDLVSDIAGKRIEREHSGPTRDVRPQVR